MDYRKTVDEISDMFMGSTESEVSEIYKKREADIDFILRNKIQKPIKGKITKGKLRWRGIKSLVFDPDHIFIGILQRDKVFTTEGVYEIISVSTGDKIIKIGL